MAIISTSHKFIYLILFSLYVFFTPLQVVNFSEYKKRKKKKESFVMNKMKIFKTFKEFSLVFFCQANFSAPLCFQLFFRGNQFSRKSSANDFVTDAFTCDSLTTDVVKAVISSAALSRMALQMMLLQRRLTSADSLACAISF